MLHSFKVFLDVKHPTNIIFPFLCREQSSSISKIHISFFQIGFFIFRFKLLDIFFVTHSKIILLLNPIAFSILFISLNKSFLLILFAGSSKAKAVKLGSYLNSSSKLLFFFPFLIPFPFGSSKSKKNNPFFPLDFSLVGIPNLPFVLCSCLVLNNCASLNKVLCFVFCAVL